MVIMQIVVMCVADRDAMLLVADEIPYRGAVDTIVGRIENALSSLRMMVPSSLTYARSAASNTLLRQLSIARMNELRSFV
ncbi:MAG: hypothetical protein Gaeavirus40_2 [Gaeavirus sp.]|uniref:Uncharacterized protein n=1 Tax=Gaeavirus sp. TaxID=2487767 RepID=A0A3G4ZZL3_9VIRU|nr:MAG: hypothetical protein Gaeavirus40_2 [Gaeavirus sp.]